MSRHLFRIVALVLALGLQSQVASAQTSSWNWLFGQQDSRLTASSIVVGAAADGAYWAMRRKVWYGGIRTHHFISQWGAYGISSVGCAALFPIVGTIWVNRPLTPREAYVGIANCFVPFIGGWFVEAYLPHTAWYDGTPARVVHVRHHHHHK